MTNIFTPSGAQQMIDRINKLHPSSQPQWGKMSADQVLRHMNVAYEFVFEPEKHKKPNAFMKFIMKTFIKKLVVGEKPYPKNSRTAPAFIITSPQNFDKEKEKLIENISKMQKLGEQHFDGLENFSFGKMTKTEWNNLFSKHLEHHLQQFGV